MRKWKIGLLALLLFVMPMFAASTASSGQPTVGVNGVSLGIPSGVILPFGGTTAPTGWMLCDGSSLLRTDYPALFAAIGTAFGAADGTHFNIPDTRGRFVRGVDHAQARDPDRATRTAMATGGNTGDLVGSVQVEQVKNHTHTGTYYNTTATYHAQSGAGIDMAYGAIPSSGGGNETRPLNIGLEYIIKL